MYLESKGHVVHLWEQYFETSECLEGALVKVLGDLNTMKMRKKYSVYLVLEAQKVPKSFWSLLSYQSLGHTQLHAIFSMLLELLSNSGFR